MKRVVSLFVFALLLNGCDDGNLTLETIDFKDIKIQSCTTNNIIYKLKDKEALLLEIPQSNFVNNPTAVDTPTEININNSSIRLVYRFYNGTVAPDNICNTIPPASPNVTDQWTASSGIIQINTTALKSENKTENSTRITGYNHNITFKNITFDKGDGTNIKYESFPFGDYTTTVSPPAFGFDKVVEQCPTSKQIYNYVSSEALTIEKIDPALIVNVETLDTPRTALIGSVNNKVSYRIYSDGILTASYFCNSTIPSLPTVKEEWNAVNGVDGASGIIEVTTVKNGTSAYKHTIVFKNVTLKKGNSDFKLGDNYIYGELTTTN